MIDTPWGPALVASVALGTWAGALAMARQGRSGLAGVVAGAVALACLFWGWHVDDAGIVYAYARALAAGEGLVPGAGLAPVEGFSDPAWVALLTAAAAVGVAPPLAAKLLQLGLVVVTPLLVVRIAARAGATRAGATVAAAAVATSGPWAVWAASGLETALYGVLLAAVAWVAGGRPEAGDAGREAVGRLNRGDVAVVGLVALAAWTRPEGGLGAAVVAVAAAWAVRGRLRREGLVAAALGLAVGAGSLLGVRYLWLGVTLPNTAVAKLSVPDWLALIAGFVYIAIGFVLTAWLLWGLAARPALRGPRRRVVLAAGWVAAVAAAFALVAGGDWMGHARLFAPYSPVLLAWLVPRVGEGAGRCARLETGLAVLAALVGVGVLAHAAARPTLPIDHGLRRGGLYLALGSSVCGAPTVATPDIGGVLYAWPEVQVTDLVGLVDAPAARRRGEPGYWPTRIAAERPALIAQHGGWARRTGLSDDVLAGLDYRIACRRGPEPTAPTLWIDARCTGTPSPEAARGLATLCERGSGVGW